MSLRDVLYSRLQDRADAVGGFLTIGGDIVAPILKAPAPKYACELFWTNKCDETFGVRYTDGSEEIVRDTEANRNLYGSMIDYYRERMDALLGWRD